MVFIVRLTNYITDVVRGAFVFLTLAVLTLISGIPQTAYAAAPVVDATAQGPAFNDLLHFALHLLEATH